MIHQAVDRSPSGGDELTASDAPEVMLLANPLFHLERSFSVEGSGALVLENLC